MKGKRNYPRLAAGITGVILSCSFACAQALAQGDGLWISPLSGPQYRILERDWIAHQAAGGEFAKEFKAAAKRGRSSKPKAYLAMAEVVERRVGHYDLAFKLLVHARETLASVSPREQEDLRATIDSLEKKLMASKVAALRSLGDPNMRQPPSRILAMQFKNEIEAKAISCEHLAGESEAIRTQLEKTTHTYLQQDNRFPPIPTVEDAVITDRGLYFLDRTYAELGPGGWRDWAVRSSGSDDPCFWLLIDDIQGLFMRSTGSKTTMSQGKYVISLGPIIPVKRWEFSNYAKLSDVPPYPGELQLRDLEQFVGRYPETLEALRTAFDRSWFLAALDLDSARGYEEYLAAFPDGLHREEGKRKLERKQYEGALAEDSEAIYREFLQSHPDSVYAADVRSKLEMAEVRKAASKEALSAMMSGLESTAAQVEARKRVEYFDFLAASEVNTLAGYSGFLSAYPDSSLREEAERAIQELKDGARFDAVRRENSQGAYETFLDEFPKSRFAPEAEAMLALFDVKQRASIDNIERFLKLRRVTKLAAVTQKGYDFVLSLLRGMIARRYPRVADAIMLLYEEERNPDFPLAAFSLSENKDQELRAVMAMSPEQRLAVFDVGLYGTAEPNRSWEVQWFLGSQRDVVRPEVPGWVRSKARHGAYRITVELSMNVHYTKRYVGVTWFNPNYKDDTSTWQETFTATAETTVRAGVSRENIKLSFPRILLRRSPGFEFLVGWETIGTPDERFTCRITKIEPLG